MTAQQSTPKPLATLVRASEKVPAITAPLFVGLIGVLSLLAYRRRPHASALHEAARALPRIGITQAVLAELPRHSFHASGKPMEPMNIVLIGSKRQLRELFAGAGWYEALPVSVWNLLRAQLAVIFNWPFLHGPVTPLFVGVRQQTLAFQKPTEANTFRVRHHMRLWPTEHRTTNGDTIWIGQASFDDGIKQTGSLVKVPVHHIAEDLDAERDELRRDLLKAGGQNYGYVQLQKANRGVNAFDDAFMCDGRAAVVGATT